MIEGFSFYIWLAVLGLLVLSNNAVGMVQAIVTKTYDKAKAQLGLIKALGVTISMTTFFYAGSLIPNLEFQFDGNVFTLHGILSVVMFTTIGAFAVKAIKKIIELMGINVSGDKGE